MSNTNPLDRPLVFGDREQINAIRALEAKAEIKDLQVKHQDFENHPSYEVSEVRVSYDFKCPECGEVNKGDDTLDIQWNETDFEIECDCGLLFTYDHDYERINVIP